MNKYSASLRFFHWIIGLLVIGMLAFGLYMVAIPIENPLRATMYRYHKSIGVLILALIIFRIISRVFSNIPSFPSKFSLLEKICATFSHYLLYLCMFSASFSGFLMSMMSGRGINFFGYQLPNFLPLDKEIAGLMHYIHTSLPLFFITLISLHICATLYHHLKQKINVIGRIW